MTNIGSLLKLTTAKEAIIYKVLEDTETTAIKVEEVFKISQGKMILCYDKRVVSHIYKSELAHSYKELNADEYSRILSILSDTLKEIGF